MATQRSTQKFLNQQGVGTLWGKILTELDKKQDVIDSSHKLSSELVSGLGDLATKSEVAESDLASALATKINGKQDAIAANTYAGYAYEAKVDTLIDEDTGKSAREIAAEELAAKLIPEDAQESLDTLQEIAAWIQDHPEDASDMAADISALEGLHATDSQSGDKLTVAQEIAAAMSGISGYYSETDGQALEDAIDGILDGTNIDSFGDVETALSGKQDTIAANTYDAYGAAAAVIGAAADASSATTVYGAKAFATEEATAVYNAITALNTSEIEAAITEATTAHNTPSGE